MGTVSFTLEPVPPFDLDLTCAIFASGDPQIRVFQNGIFRQALDILGTPVLVEVRSRRLVEQPQILVSCHTEMTIRKAALVSLRQTVTAILGTADNPALFYRAMADDPVMDGLTRQLRGLRCPATPTIFEAIIDSVIEQQISLAAARSIENRLIRLVGKQCRRDDGIFFCYPNPAILAEIPDPVVRSCGLTRRKGEYIRGISREILEGSFDPEAFRNEPDTESIIREMVKIRGIGRWTAELAILRGLHRPDAFPADDVAVRRFISRFYQNGAKVSPAEARVFAGRWGGYCGFAAFYLEAAELLGIRPGDLPGQGQKEG